MKVGMSFTNVNENEEQLWGFVERIGEKKHDS